MAVGHVGADDEEQVGVVEVGVGARRPVGAQRLLVAGAGAGHAQPRVRLDVHGAQEALGQLGGQILRLDRHLAGHVERDRVGAVLVDDRAQPAARFGDGVVDRRRAPARRRATAAPARSSAGRRSAAIISACVAPLVHNRPKLVGCSLSPDTCAMTGTPVAGSVRVSTEIPQPTPQYEHAVRVVIRRQPAAAPARAPGRCVRPRAPARACIRRNTNQVTNAQTT